MRKIRHLTMAEDVLQNPGEGLETDGKGLKKRRTANEARINPDSEQQAGNGGEEDTEE